MASGVPFLAGLGVLSFRVGCVVFGGLWPVCLGGLGGFRCFCSSLVRRGCVRVFVASFGLALFGLVFIVLWLGFCLLGWVVGWLCFLSQSQQQVKSASHATDQLHAGSNKSNMFWQVDSAGRLLLTPVCPPQFLLRRTPKTESSPH